MPLEKLDKTTKGIEKQVGDKNKIHAATSVMNWLKRNWRKSSLFVAGGAVATGAFSQNVDVNSEGDRQVVNSNNKRVEAVDYSKTEVNPTSLPGYNPQGKFGFIYKNQSIRFSTEKDMENAKDVLNVHYMDKDGKKKDNTVEFYSKDPSNKELEFALDFKEDIRQKYREGKIRPYDVFVFNSRFRKLREIDFKDATEEESIQYGEKMVKVRLFKKGHGKELIQYLKKAYGLEKANQIISDWEIDKDSYESLKNLSRDQFVRGVIHGQNKEHTKWVWLKGDKPGKGFPYVVLHTKKDGFMEGFGECSGNVVFERESVSCEDTEIHNSNTK